MPPASTLPRRHAAAPSRSRRRAPPPPDPTPPPLPQNIRVVQPNLVYAVGLSLDICHEEALRDQQYFGQFGRTGERAMPDAGST